MCLSVHILPDCLGCRFTTRQPGKPSSPFFLEPFIVKAEVPMAEMLTYGTDPTSMTQGCGRASRWRCTITTWFPHYSRRNHRGRQG